MASKRLGADAQIRHISSTEIFRHLSNSGNYEKNHLIRGWPVFENSVMLKKSDAQSETS